MIPIFIVAPDKNRHYMKNVNKVNLKGIGKIEKILKQALNYLNM